MSTRWRDGVDEVVAWLDSVGWTYTLEPTAHWNPGRANDGAHSAILWPIVERVDEACFAGIGSSPSDALASAVVDLRASGLLALVTSSDDPIVVMGDTCPEIPPIMGTPSWHIVGRVLVDWRAINLAGCGESHGFEVFTGRRKRAVPASRKMVTGPATFAPHKPRVRAKAAEPRLAKRNGRPPTVAVDRDFGVVARVANEARANGKMAASAIMDHYNVNYAVAKNLIAQARREGYEITPGPMGGQHGAPVMEGYVPVDGDRVVVCADGDFVRPAARRVELVAHCRTAHDRAATRHELVVVAWPVE